MSDIVVPATPTLEGPIQTAAVITNIEVREVVLSDGSETTYVDFHLRPEDKELSAILGNNAIKVGFPFRMNPDTALGQFCKRFGLNPAADINLTKEFLGNRVQVICDKEEGKGGGMFWRIDRGAILPIKGNNAQKTLA